MGSYRRDNILMRRAVDGKGSFRPLTQLSEAMATSKKSDMPPRLVVFVYLQDVPTWKHGPTVFLPGSANAAAHAKVLQSTGAIQPGFAGGNDASWMATCRAGDAVVYDASVLHYGAANTVAGNDRVVFYFGISRGGHAMSCAGRTPAGWEPTDPVKLWDYV